MATLQSPTARCPASRSERVTMPTGFVKSTIHARRRRADRSAISRRRDRTQGLREAARARGLLSDASASQRHRLVGQPGGLPADSDLDEHEVGSVQGGPSSSVTTSSRGTPAHGASGGEPIPDAPPGARGRCLAGRSSTAASSRVRARHELGGVRRASSDHRDLHPLTPVSVTPSTNAFLGEEEDDDHGQHHEHRRRHRQVPLHLVQRAELGEADRRHPAVGVLARVEQWQEAVVPGRARRRARPR